MKNKYNIVIMSMTINLSKYIYKDYWDCFYMLSIIIPTLNEENYIPNLLNCLANQKCQDFEVMIVDGNSDDNTREIAKEYNKKLRIKILNTNIRNVSYQRNLGLGNSTNERVLFLDADTSFDNNFLYNALNELETKKLKISGCLVYPNSTNFVDKLFFLGYRGFLRIFYKIIGFNGCCIFTLKSLHNRINGFDENIKVSEDFDYARRLSKITKTHILNSTKIYTSVRRFEKYGRLKTGIKVLLIGLYTLFIGKITSDIFNYRFNHIPFGNFKKVSSKHKKVLIEK